jgi:hypothetical protein
MAKIRLYAPGQAPYTTCIWHLPVEMNDYNHQWHCVYPWDPTWTGMPFYPSAWFGQLTFEQAALLARQLVSMPQIVKDTCSACHPWWITWNDRGNYIRWDIYRGQDQTIRAWPDTPPVPLRILPVLWDPRNPDPPPGFLYHD